MRNNLGEESIFIIRAYSLIIRVEITGSLIKMAIDAN